MEKINIIQQKIQIIQKDLDTAYSSYQSHVNKLANLRGLSVTIFLAYSGYIAGKEEIDLAFLIPFVLYIFLFMLTEANERFSMTLNVKSVIEIQTIFSMNDEESFLQAVKQYEFRDIKLENTTRKKSIRDKFKNNFQYALIEKIYFWYGIQLVAIGILFSIKH